MKKLLCRLIARFGSEVTAVFGSEQRLVRCVFEPTTSRSWQNMRRQIRDLGQLPQGQFEYIGTEDLGAADYLLRGTQVYLLRRCEPVYLQNECICYWGLAVPVGEESQWKRW